MAPLRFTPVARSRHLRHARYTGSGLAAALSLLLATAPAEANGRFPTAQHVVVGPGTASDTLALRTTFGVLTSLDAGRTWHWRCEEMLGYLYTAVWDPPITLGSRTTDGTALLVGLTNGLSVSLDDCTSRAIPSVDGRFTGDITTSPDGQTVYWVSSDQSPNAVFVSRDGGRTFTVLSNAVEGVLFETLEVAPSDPSRLYLTGVTLAEPQSVVLYRSTDGGQTIAPIPTQHPTTIDHLFLSAIDPRDPSHLWFRATLPRSTASIVLESRDGGTTTTERFRSTGAIKGFALSDDGQTVWVGSSEPNEGLQIARNGGAFAPIANWRIECLRYHAGALYLCGNELSDGFALGRSNTEGRTVTPLLRFGDALARTTCGPTSTWTTRCDPLWPILDTSLRPLRDAGPDLGPTLDATITRDAPDAGPPAPPPEPSSSRGCGCEVRPSNTSSAWLLSGFAAMLAWQRRRRRATTG